MFQEKYKVKSAINNIKYKPAKAGKVKIEKVVKVKAVKPIKEKYGKQFVGWGESKTITKWSHDSRNIYNLSIGCLTKRIHKMTIEEAFSLRRQIPAKSVMFFSGYGETKPLNEWVKDKRNIYKLSYMALHRRIVKNKYTIEKALSFSSRKPTKLRF